MKTVSWIAGVLGILVALVAVLTRVAGVAYVRVLGHAHAPATVLIVGILLLVVAIWLAVLRSPEKK